MTLVETAADVGQAAAGRSRQGRLPDADHAGRRRGRRHRGAITERFPAATGPGSDDICYATTNRQRAVQAIARESDLVLVAGSANSSNSQRLVETAERAGTPAYLVDGAAGHRARLARRARRRSGSPPARRRRRPSSARSWRAGRPRRRCETKDVVVPPSPCSSAFPRSWQADSWPGLTPRPVTAWQYRQTASSTSIRIATDESDEKDGAIMSMPLRQSLRVGTYLMRQKLARREKFPLLVELEPLFACNLKCAGCGKIQQPASLLKQRMPVEQALAAIEECGAPMVSIAGGEPLMHPQIDVLVDELIKRKKFVFLCTNALLIPKKLDKFKPSPYFAWVVHIDGLRERHDESVCKEGVFDEAVAAIKECQRRGFRVNTNTTFFNTDTPQTVIDVLNLPERRPQDRRHADLARLRLREGAGPGPLPRRDRDAGAVPQGVRRREPASAGGSTTRRCSWTSSRARSTTAAPRGASRPTRCSAGSGRAT